MQWIYLVIALRGVLANALFATEDISIQDKAEKAKVSLSAKSSDSYTLNTPEENPKKSMGASILDFFRSSPAPVSEQKPSSTSKPSKTHASASAHPSASAGKSVSTGTHAIHTATVRKITQVATETVKSMKPAKTTSIAARPRKSADIYTITVTEYRYVTVYQPIVAAPEPTHAGLFAGDNINSKSSSKKSTSSRKTVKIQPNIKDTSITSNAFKQEEAAIASNEKILKEFKKNQKDTKKRIEKLQKELSEIEKNIAVSTEQIKGKKAAIDTRHQIYKEDTTIFKKKKSSAEKEINSTSKNLNKVEGALEQTKAKKKSLEAELKAEQQNKKQLQKTAKDLKKMVKKEFKEEKKTVEKAEKTVEKEEKALDKKEVSLDKEKAGLDKSEKKEKEREKKDKEREKKEKEQEKKEKEREKKEKSREESFKKESTLLRPSTALIVSPQPPANTPAMPMPPNALNQPLKKEKLFAPVTTPKPANGMGSSSDLMNPLDSQQKNMFSNLGIPPFTQNFTNGHLVVSGTPINNGPDALKRTQDQFKDTMRKAVAKAKPGEKLLAFWGHITSLLAGSQ
ncbi:hypothetical protein NEHOM01_2336 [Nematocida homosporus]|uniref:uncharacterized protein n=1 Tax=Nematocida homosporus TaxID=1912981 RepID=UPI00221F135A|nr:uncharacterized protein NEHOM01_2336 [Nematocida homosporus]KAI5187742.1 hypothetical protein NEHOM01_2336 [Nematocida homosporus]